MYSHAFVLTVFFCLPASCSSFLQTYRRQHHHGYLTPSNSKPSLLHPAPECFVVHASRIGSQEKVLRHQQCSYSTLSSRRFNFFRDLLGKAFDNDDSLSTANKREGQLDEGIGEDSQNEGMKRPLTDTQLRWQRFQQQQKQSIQSLVGYSIDLDFFLTGVPNKDPSNDLYGSKINISTRDRQVGLTVPEQPTISGVQVDFLDIDGQDLPPSSEAKRDGDGSGKCRCLSETPFTSTDTLGDWKLATSSSSTASNDAGVPLRFRIPVKGYARTIETKGTIQKIYWSNEEGQIRQTSTTYSIPEGWLYGEAQVIMKRSNTGIVDIQFQEGVLKIERKQGLLGAATTLIPCGKFLARTRRQSSSP